MGSSYSISKLPENGVDFNFINFDVFSQRIKENKNESALISGIFYSGTIAVSYLNDPIFMKDSTFSEEKENIVFLGSYAGNDNVAFQNQKELLSKLEKTIDVGKYNLIYKPHPKEYKTRRWIEESNKNISYFNDVPYEFWQVLAGHQYVFNYKGNEHAMNFPRGAKSIYGIFSTSLYGEEMDEIKHVFSFNELAFDGTLSPEIGESALEDKKEFKRWQELTKTNNTLYSTSFEWLHSN